MPLLNYYSKMRVKVQDALTIETTKGMKNANIFGLTVIHEEKEVMYFGTGNPDEFQKWIEAFSSAFKDITEEHRTAARTIAAESRRQTRQSGVPEKFNFGRGALGKGKSAGSKSALSSVVMKKALCNLT
jgi:hypothetical protein